MMVGRWVSFWDCLFLGAILNFRGVFFDDILNCATLKTCSQKVYQHRLGNSVMWELHGMFGLMESWCKLMIENKQWNSCDPKSQRLLNPQETPVGVYEPVSVSPKLCLHKPIHLDLGCMPQLRKNADTDIATDVLGAEFTKKNLELPIFAIHIMLTDEWFFPVSSISHSNFQAEPAPEERHRLGLCHLASCLGHRAGFLCGGSLWPCGALPAAERGTSTSSPCGAAQQWHCGSAGHHYAQQEAKWCGLVSWYHAWEAMDDWGSSIYALEVLKMFQFPLFHVLLPWCWLRSVQFRTLGQWSCWQILSARSIPCVRRPLGALFQNTGRKSSCLYISRRQV